MRVTLTDEHVEPLWRVPLFAPMTDRQLIAGLEP
jgi:hypothetical protein